MKKLRKFFSAICIGLVASICFSISAYSLSSYVLKATRYQQERDSWCWAASIYTISKYSMGNSYSQSQIVTSVYGSAVNKGASLEDAAYAMRVNTGFQTNLYYSPLSYSQVQSRINAKRSFYMSLHWNDSGNWHAVVCDGYNSDNLHIVDPWIGCSTMYVDYNASKESVKFCSGEGVWENGFYV